MVSVVKHHDMITDFITGGLVPDIGAEAARQAMERYLVTQKGYAKSDIDVDADISVDINGERYQSRLDLIVSAGGRRFMVIKCAAGSLESRQREVLAAARVLDTAQPIPYAAAADGKTAVIFDTVSGKKIAEGLTAIPSHPEALLALKAFQPVLMTKERLEKEKIIFRSYDGMNVNVARKTAC